MKRMDNNQPWATACPEAAVMVDYITGKLSPALQHAFEAHVLDCPLCEDALEGLQALKTPEKLTGITEELIHRSQKPDGKSAPVRNLFRGGYRIAAVLAVVVLGAAALYLLRPEQQTGHIALEQQPETISTAPSAQPDAATPKDMTAPDSETKQEKPLMARPPAAGSTRIPATTGQEEVTATRGAVREDHLREESAVAEMEKSTKQEQTKTIEQDAETRSSEGVADKNNTAPAPTVAAPERSTTARNTSDRQKKEADTSFPVGMASFQAGQYGEALESFKKEPGNPVALFHAGRCYYELQQPAEALRTFNSYIATKHAVHREAAWWYKALAEKQLNDLKSAKQSLQKVIGFHGQYEQPAARLLRTLP